MQHRKTKPRDPAHYRNLDVAVSVDGRLEAVGITDRVRDHDLPHAALTNLAATGPSPIAVLATAEHGSMETTTQYVHLAGVVFETTQTRALSPRVRGYQASQASQFG